jgi:hypothetical protein
VIVFLTGGKLQLSPAMRMQPVESIGKLFFTIEINSVIF